MQLGSWGGVVVRSDAAWAALVRRALGEGVLERHALEHVGLEQVHLRQGGATARECACASCINGTGHLPRHAGRISSEGATVHATFSARHLASALLSVGPPHAAGFPPHPHSNLWGTPPLRPASPLSAQRVRTGRLQGAAAEMLTSAPSAEALSSCSLVTVRDAPSGVSYTTMALGLPLSVALKPATLSAGWHSVSAAHAVRHVGPAWHSSRALPIDATHVP